MRTKMTATARMKMNMPRMVTGPGASLPTPRGFALLAPLSSSYFSVLSEPTVCSRRHPCHHRAVLSAAPRHPLLTRHNIHHIAEQSLAAEPLTHSQLLVRIISLAVRHEHHSLFLWWCDPCCSASDCAPLLSGSSGAPPHYYSRTKDSFLQKEEGVPPFPMNFATRIASALATVIAASAIHASARRKQPPQQPPRLTSSLVLLPSSLLLLLLLPRQTTAPAGSVSASSSHLRRRRCHRRGWDSRRRQYSSSPRQDSLRQ